MTALHLVNFKPRNPAFACAHKTAKGLRTNDIVAGISCVPRLLVLELEHSNSSDSWSSTEPPPLLAFIFCCAQQQHWKRVSVPFYAIKVSVSSPLPRRLPILLLCLTFLDFLACSCSARLYTACKNNPPTLTWHMPTCTCNDNVMAYISVSSPLPVAPPGALSPTATVTVLLFVFLSNTGLFALSASLRRQIHLLMSSNDKCVHITQQHPVVIYQYIHCRIHQSTHDTLCTCVTTTFDIYPPLLSQRSIIMTTADNNNNAPTPTGQEIILAGTRRTLTLPSYNEDAQAQGLEDVAELSC